MGQCNAQTSSALSGMVSDQSTAPLSRIYTTPKEEPPSYSNLRGLDLIKSCAKYYDNGAGVAIPTLRISNSLGAPLKQSAITEPPAPRQFKGSISTVAMMCSLLLLSVLVWRGFLNKAADEPASYLGDASAKAAQLPSPAITASLNIESADRAQAPLNSDPDIIIHKVKTETITGDTLGPERDVR